MILWHLGAGCALVYVTLGRRRIDYRFIMAGAVLPDLVDGLLVTFVLDEPAGRAVAHSLLVVIALGVAVTLAFRGTARLSVFGLAVGWLTHLVADGLWAAPETFLWPAFGTDFATFPAEPYSWDLLIRPLDHLSTWLGEIAGAAVLLWFWIAYRLGREGRFRLFLKDGYLRP